MGSMLGARRQGDGQTGQRQLECQHALDRTLPPTTRQLATSPMEHTTKVSAEQPPASVPQAPPSEM